MLHYLWSVMWLQLPMTKLQPAWVTRIFDNQIKCWHARHTCTLAKETQKYWKHKYMKKIMKNIVENVRTRNIKNIENDEKDWNNWKYKNEKYQKHKKIWGTKNYNNSKNYEKYGLGEGDELKGTPPAHLWNVKCSKTSSLTNVTCCLFNNFCPSVSMLCSAQLPDLCGCGKVQTTHHILHDCTKFKPSCHTMR